jgi:hypothetical protein
VSGDQAGSRDLVLGRLSKPTRPFNGAGCKERDKVNQPLVFDNADSFDLWREFWHVGERESILITSRDPLALINAYVPSSNGLILTLFPTDEAASLLRSITKHEST